MDPQWIWEYVKAIHLRYHKSGKKEKTNILDEFVKVHGCHRKHAIRLLGGPPPKKHPLERKKRSPTYGPRLISILKTIWEVGGRLWSKRLKAALPIWMPWVKRRFILSPKEEEQLLRISPAQIDRRLKDVKQRLKKRIYGGTRPGSLLKHQIPIKTDHWDVHQPGFTEVDLVSHSGSSAAGEFANTLDMTDIHTTWVERRAVLGKGERAVLAAMQEIEEALPFPLLGIDSDNGSEFINAHLYTYCVEQEIQFTRGRPYKKDDNAHIEQKNWTHVRQLLGYLRYDTEVVLEAMNDLYRHELRYFQNFFQPSVKLKKKVRVGSRLTKVYDDPKTPWERVQKSKGIDPVKVQKLEKIYRSLDPFELSKTIDEKLEAIYRMATSGKGQAAKLIEPASPPLPLGAAYDPWPELWFDPIPRIRLMLERGEEVPAL